MTPVPSRARPSLLPAVLLLLPWSAMGGSSYCPVTDETSGVVGCSSMATSDACAVVFVPECAPDVMYPPDHYTPGGIPCGFSTDDACGDAAPISFTSDDFDDGEFDLLDDYLDETIFSRGDHLPQELIDASLPGYLELLQCTLVNVTFLHEGACYRNSLGIIHWPTDKYPPPDLWTPEIRKDVLLEETMSIFFLNMDFEYCTCGFNDTSAHAPLPNYCTETAPTLAPPATMKMLYDPLGSPRVVEDLREEDFFFPAGTSIAFFLVPDGYDLGLERNQSYAGDAGELLFTVPQLNDPAMASFVDPVTLVPDVRQHHYAFLGPQDLNGTDFSDKWVVTMEDVRRDSQSSNQDFEDVAFFVDVDLCPPTAAPTLPPSSGAPSEAPSVSSAPSPAPLCQNGFLSPCGNTCCPLQCGGCGGCNCRCLPGGPEECCAGGIEEVGRPCLLPGDVACVMPAPPGGFGEECYSDPGGPTQCAEDRCL